MANIPADSNIRLTTAYVFQVRNKDTGNYHSIWADGEEPYVYIAVAEQPDLTSIALVFDADIFPPGTPNSNYRINENNQFQFYNPTTAKYYSAWVTGTAENPELSVAAIGED